MHLTNEQWQTLTSRFRLSPRERECLRLVLAGVVDNADLARRLGLSVASAKMLVRQLYMKTGTDNKTRLVLLAMEVVLGDQSRDHLAEH